MHSRSVLLLLHINYAHIIRWYRYIDLVPCDTDQPCENSATCTNTGAGGYTCTCPPGYHGQHCQNEDNECESSPCINGNCEVRIPAGCIMKIALVHCVLSLSLLLYNRISSMATSVTVPQDGLDQHVMLTLMTAARTLVPTVAAL